MLRALQETDFGDTINTQLDAIATGTIEQIYGQLDPIVAQVAQAKTEAEAAIAAAANAAADSAAAASDAASSVASSSGVDWSGPSLEQSSEMSKSMARAEDQRARKIELVEALLEALKGLADDQRTGDTANVSATRRVENLLDGLTQGGAELLTSDARVLAAVNALSEALAP